MMFFISVILGVIIGIFTDNMWYALLCTLFYGVINSKLFKIKYVFIYSLIFLCVFINYNRKLYNLESFKGEVTGRVISVKNKSTVLKTDTINGKKFKTKILFYDKLNEYSKYKIFGNFAAPDEAMNEGNFNANLNYKSQGIYLIGKIDDIIEYNSNSSNQIFGNFYIRKAQNIFDKHLNNRNARLLKSIILGDRTNLLEYQNQRFKELGLSHLLAVSGLHIGILALFLNISLIKITGNKKITDILTLIIIGLYIYSIGFPISVVRAYLFFILYKLNLYFSVDLRSKDVFFISLGLILFVNPLAIYSLSLIMSYGAIFAIIFLYPKIKSYFTVNNLFVESILISLSVIIMLYPILVYNFGYISFLVLAANVIIVPIYSIIIALGFILSVGIIPGIVGNIENFLLNSVYGLESLLLKFNFLSLNNLSFNINYLGLYYFAILSFYFKDYKYNIISRSRFVIFIYIFTILLNIGMTNINQYYAYAQKHIYVGQGDCTLIMYKGHNYLIDTGGSKMKNKFAERFLFPVFNYNGIRNIDAIFISHFDEDHVGNLSKIIDNYKVHKIYLSYIPEDISILKKAQKNSKLKLLDKNDILFLNDSIKIKVLSDNNLVKNADANDKSLVFMVQYGEYKSLFTGDISENIEKNIDEDIDILKVAHHGSKTSTGEEFLNRTTPKLAIISSGRDNIFGHPHQEVTTRLQEKNIKFLNTKDCGQISIYINRGGSCNVDKFLDKTSINIYTLSVIILKSLILFILAKGEYELQKNLFSRYS